LQHHRQLLKNQLTVDMSKSTRNTLRLISVIIVLALVLMELNVIPNLLNYKFWFMVAAYALALITYR
jgi:uncharacterized protein YebE (UPF0316 family)